MVIKKKHPSTIVIPVREGKRRPLSYYPVPRWCHYGRWTPDGQHVLNAAGDVVYPVIIRKKKA